MCSQRCGRLCYVITDVAGEHYQMAGRMWRPVRLAPDPARDPDILKLRSLREARAHRRAELARGIHMRVVVIGG